MGYKLQASACTGFFIIITYTSLGECSWRLLTKNQDACLI